MSWPACASRMEVLASFAALSVLLAACVGDEPAIPTGDAGSDVMVIARTDAGADATVVEREPDAGEEAGEASTPDAGADSAPDAMTGPVCPATDLVCGQACVPNDPLNCGTCGHDCTNLANVSGAVTCVSGVCAFAQSACKPGFAHCSGSPDLGCETSITTQNNCGGCGTECGVAAPLCSSNGSSYGCVSGCMGTAPTLCNGTTCVNTTDDAENCMACNMPCTTAVAHAQATCSMSTCGYACTASYPNACNGGCVNFSNDSSNCGTCGHACTGGMTCQAGGCACPGGTHDCSGTCDSNSSTASCGATSCSACPVPANGSATCDGTSCGIGCSGGFTQCGSTCVDETKNGNCGGCGVSCPVSCTGSQCVKAIAIGAGVLHSCALLSNGTVECWGDNNYGELGYATTQTCSSSATPCSLSPQVVPNLTGVVALTVADLTNCALLTNGTVKCWGYNNYGQLGVAPSGSCAASPSCFSMMPVTVPLSSTAIAIAAGYSATCAVMSGGTVECWGGNMVGQLGNGSTTAETGPQLVSVITTATAVALGELHACAILSDHTVDCWGDDDADELGYTTTTCNTSDTCSDTPMQVGGLTVVTAIAAGATHTCALVGTTMKCWGYFQQGLGDMAATGESTTPIMVANLSAVSAIGVGDEAACAVVSGGAVACWGTSPLGDGSTNEASTPVAASNLTGATAIAIGQDHKCALLSTGAVSCWSDNTYGQLGNGTNTPSLVPTPVVW